LRLISSVFSDGAAIPRRYTCEGADVSPPLTWSDAPPDTDSFVLLCDDPDAPAGTWHHWAAYDIPADQTGLQQGAAQHASRHGFRQAVNDFQRTGYGGPCPPGGHGPHRYHFRLLALSIDHLAIPQGASCRDVEREARKHVLAEAVLIGIYER
jgi:Raf kinase inhibitor-like YbhB/YbcL family protein